MDNGWIKLHRTLQAHWIWNSNEPFDKRSAWIDLLMLANFTDLKVMRNGKLKQRRRGEVNTSIQWLAKRWKWDRRKVNRFLMALESDSMVSVNSTRDGTTITIENYGVWQDVCTTDATTDGTTDGTTDSTTDGTHDKNAIKKVKKEKKVFIVPTKEEVVQYIQEKGLNVDADKFYEYYAVADWHDAKGKPVKNWKQRCLTWHGRGDKYDTTRSNGERKGVRDPIRKGERNVGESEKPDWFRPFTSATALVKEE